MKAICGRTINIKKKAIGTRIAVFLLSTIAYKNKQTAKNEIASFPKPALQKLIEGIKKISNQCLLSFSIYFLSVKYNNTSPNEPKILKNKVAFK